MRQWQNTIKFKKENRESNVDEVDEVYKKEILDTRITVSGLIENSRLINFSDLKEANKNSKNKSVNNK